MIAFVDTPLAAPVVVPESRTGGLAPELLPAFDASSGSSVAAKLRHPDVLMVTTGQQPGLFTGPLYTIHKALSARAVAAELERRWRRPVVPVFWLASDDHDYAEASVASWLAADGGLVTVQLPPRPAGDPQRPMAREPLPETIDAEIDRLAGDLPEGPARDQVIGWLRRHYRPGISFAAAFGGALAEMLAPLGIACFDPTHPAAKRAAAGILRAALDQAPALESILVARGEALAADDLAPDVKVGGGATLVFRDGANGRDRLVVAGSGFRSRRGGEALSAGALVDELSATPERFSPNVLLRPVVEAALLPTVAYLAGPGELRYLRLAEALYQPLGVIPQRPLPRWSGIVLEPRTTRAIDRFQTSLAELTADARGVETRLLKSVAPADFDPAFSDLRAAVDHGFDRIGAVAKEIDPTLERPAANAKGAALAQLAELERRLLAAQKRRQSELVSQLDRARAAVVPGGKPQERVIGVASYLGRYGPDFLTALAEHVDGWYRAALEGGGATP